MFWEKHDLHVYGGKLTCLWIFRLTHLQAKKFFSTQKKFFLRKSSFENFFLYFTCENTLSVRHDRKIDRKNIDFTSKLSD